MFPFDDVILVRVAVVGDNAVRGLNCTAYTERNGDFLTHLKAVNFDVTSHDRHKF